jgi:CheY-like chemotaxis protein
MIAEIDRDARDIPSERVSLIFSQDIVTHAPTQAEVLIVDDSSFNRLVLRKMLESAGYSYAEASTGLEAVSMIRAAWDREKPFSLVLMDVEMPEMDEITATRELGVLVAQGLLPSLPVITGCSAYCMEEDRANARAAGMTDYMEKPISRQRLFELLRFYYH